MSSSPWLLVHEYVTGGGWPSGELPAELAAEGLAMLQAILTDYAAWGRVRTLCTLDRRLAGLDLSADEVIYVDPDDAYERAFRAALTRCAAALVIAPETGGLLAELNTCVAAAGISLLGCSPEAVRTAGDKWACYRRWGAVGVLTPFTRCAEPAVAGQVAQELGYPLVAKPADGVGCAGVCLVRNAGELERALRLAACNASQGSILLQRYVAGKHASASFLVSRGRALTLSLNGQEIQPGCPFRYRGGVVPLAHPAQAAALAAAQAAVCALPGLQGYVGVDLVLDTIGRAWVIEINPRLTTSYIGLRRVVSVNLAGAIWEACVDGVLPEAVHLEGQAVFDKDQPGGLWEGS